jgi:hypothetical protein
MNYVTAIIYYNIDSGLGLSISAQLGLFHHHANEDDDECVQCTDEFIISKKKFRYTELNTSDTLCPPQVLFMQPWS